MFGRFIPIVLITAAAFGQTETPEVRGVIHEVGSATGVSGAEVGLYEFGPNEQNFITRKLVVGTFTDANGAFTLKPGHVGEFTVSANKSGYQDASNIVILTSTALVGQTRLAMIRPGSLKGRVIDGEGNPLPNFSISIESPSPGFGDDRTTDAEGLFTASNLPPGQYVVRVSPKSEQREELLEYSDAAFKIVDQDVEPSYWPGGLADRHGVIPVPVAGGAIANVGTITVRKKPYYRVHVSLAGECAPNERWIYRIITKPEDFPPPQEQFGGCRKDFLLTGLAPGAHTLAVWVGRDVKAWGLASFTITNANVGTTLRLTPSFSVSGQVKAAEGHSLAELGSVDVLLRPEDGLGSVRQDGPVDANGMFNYKTVAWPKQLLSVTVRKSGTYVKEIRHNGLPIRGPRVDIIPGARFEILLDTGSATLTLTAKLDISSYALAVRDGMELGPSGAVPPFQFILTPERRVPGEENFTNPNLPPGTYRIVVIGRDVEDRNMSPEEFAQLVSRAEKVTIEANETKTVVVKK